MAAEVSADANTQGRVRFAAAAYLAERDKAAGLERMTAAFNPQLIYAPAELDLYGGLLLAADKLDEAGKVFEKLAADYPNPPGVAPDQAPPATQEAQAVALFGLGKALQRQGKTAEAAAKFDLLKAGYPWSPKVPEADFGIAQSKFESKQYDEAQQLVIPIIRAPNATAELRAHSFLLQGRIQEEKGNAEGAIDSYIKISVFFAGVPDTAAEGLWRGGQLIEKQAAGIADEKKRAAQMAKATKAYKDLDKTFGDSPFAPQARERLQALGPK